MPGAAPGAAPAPMPPPPSAATPPGPTGPASVAPNRGANRMRGMVQANIALEMLDKAMGLMGSASEEGQALMKALISLRKVFGTASGDLSQAEVKMLGAKAPPINAAPQDPRQAAQGKLASMFGGGGAGGPGGATPPPGGPMA